LQPDAFKDDQKVLLNAPAVLLRRKTKKDPEGRTSMRFKKAMRHNVTIIGKSAFKSTEDDGPSDKPDSKA